MTCFLFACTASCSVNTVRACSQREETHELLCKTANRKSAISGSGLWPLLSTQVCGDSGFEGGSSSAAQTRPSGSWDTFPWERVKRQAVGVVENNPPSSAVPHHLVVDSVWGLWACLGGFSNRDEAVASWLSLYLVKRDLWCSAVLALCLRTLPVKHLLYVATPRHAHLKIRLLLTQQVSVYKIRKPTFSSLAQTAAAPARHSVNDS